MKKRRNRGPQFVRISIVEKSKSEREAITVELEIGGEGIRWEIFQLGLKKVVVE